MGAGGFYGFCVRSARSNWETQFYNLRLKASLLKCSCSVRTHTQTQTHTPLYLFIFYIQLNKDLDTDAFSFVWILAVRFSLDAGLKTQI